MGKVYREKWNGANNKINDKRQGKSLRRVRLLWIAVYRKEARDGGRAKQFLEVKRQIRRKNLKFKLCPLGSFAFPWRTYCSSLHHLKHTGLDRHWAFVHGDTIRAVQKIF